MYAYTSMATGEEVPNVRRTSRTPSEDHGFTQDWVNNHTNRVAQRQLEVHDDPNGQPRTQIHMQEEEEESKLIYKKYCLEFFQRFPIEIFSTLYIFRRC